MWRFRPAPGPLLPDSCGLKAADRTGWALVKNTAPIIVKRKKVVAARGHHGGAWKVAYADFVTAMMAFFMLMWLLNATTEQQRRGIADYFSPSIPISRVSGGGNGPFGGTSIFSEDVSIREGSGFRAPLTGTQPGLTARHEAGADPAQVAALREVEETLLGRGGESLLSEQALRHVVTRLTDEGLIIELFDLPDAALFESGTATARPVTEEIAAMLARVFALVENPVAVQGHTRASPVVLAQSPVWPLSLGRASRIRELLEAGGLEPRRVQRVTGQADRQPVAPDPMAVRNNRIEVILLRSDL